MKVKLNWIVIGWLDKEGAIETDQLERFDGYNLRRKIERCIRASALVFERAESSKAAEDYIKRSPSDFDGKFNVKVFVFPIAEQNPLEKAREMLLKSK